jgi:hypothetical protein
MLIYDPKPRRADLLVEARPGGLDRATRARRSSGH